MCWTWSVGPNFAGSASFVIADEGARAPDRTGAQNTVCAALRSGEPLVFYVPERPSTWERFKVELLSEDPTLPGVWVRRRRDSGEVV